MARPVSSTYFDLLIAQTKKELPEEFQALLKKNATHFTVIGERKVSAFNFDEIQMPPRGNCLFHAVFCGLKSNPVLSKLCDELRIVSYMDLREAVVQEMREDWKIYEPFIELERRDKYLEVMAKDRSWGGDLEMRAMRNLFNVNMLIVKPGGQVQEQRMSHALPFVYLYHQAHNHYNALQPKDQWNPKVLPKEVFEREALCTNQDIAALAQSRVLILNSHFKDFKERNPELSIYQEKLMLHNLKETEDFILGKATPKPITPMAEQKAKQKTEEKSEKPILLPPLKLTRQ